MGPESAVQTASSNPLLSPKFPFFFPSASFSKPFRNYSPPTPRPSPPQPSLSCHISQIQWLHAGLLLTRSGPEKPDLPPSRTLQKILPLERPHPGEGLGSRLSHTGFPTPPSVWGSHLPASSLCIWTYSVQRLIRRDSEINRSTLLQLNKPLGKTTQPCCRPNALKIHTLFSPVTSHTPTHTYSPSLTRVYKPICTHVRTRIRPHPILFLPIPWCAQEGHHKAM